MSEKTKMSGEQVLGYIFWLSILVLMAWNGTYSLRVFAIIAIALLCVHASLFLLEPNGRPYKTYNAVMTFTVGFVFFGGGFINSFRTPSPGSGDTTIVERVFFPICFVVVIFFAVKSFLKWYNSPQALESSSSSPGDADTTNSSGNVQATNEYPRNVFNAVIHDLQKSHSILHKPAVCNSLFDQLQTKTILTGSYEKDYAILHHKVTWAVTRHNQTFKQPDHRP